MEVRQPESPLRAILNSPTKSMSQASSSAGSMGPPTTTVVPGKSSTPQANMTVVLPSSSHGDPYNSVTVQNCVSTVDLGCELNLQTITFRTRNSEYNPARFNGVVMRIREPRCTALIFRSGKMVCTGARTESDSLLASKKFARIIQKIGFNVKFIGFRVQNIVATCDLRFPIRLENLHQLHGQFSSYEPELFPGLIYRLVKPRLVLLIFVNGKMVFTGAKSRQDLKEALDSIYPILKSFKKN